MQRHQILTVLLLGALAVAASACGAPATPTPKPTVPPTPVPLPTLTPTPVPLTPTTAPTKPPTLTPTPSQPSPTPLPPTKTPLPVTPKPTATATIAKPPAPRGSIAYHVNDKGVDRILNLNLDTNVVTPLVDIGPTMDFVLGTNAHIGEFSPDNTKFAYVFGRTLGGANTLQVLDLKSGTTRSLYSDVGISSPTWAPDGNRIAFVRMYNNQQFWAVDIIDANGGNRNDIKKNTAGEQYRGGVSWSKQNILALAINSTGASDVYTMFTDGIAPPLNLTNNPADDSTPVWSPDGKMIAFTSTRDGRPQIYVMNADGSGLRRVANTQSADFSPVWSPDGNWLAFTSSRDNSTDIYIMDLHGGNVKRLTTTGADHPMWSR
jgi:dipeptidyl aminopeptidase/acylaminoacyl peptidase